MHFTSDNEFNSSNTKPHTTITNTTPTSCSTSSTDSGIIIIDNETTFNRSDNCSRSRTSHPLSTRSTCVATDDNKNKGTKNNSATSTMYEYDEKSNFTHKNELNAMHNASDKNISNRINIENTINISKANTSTEFDDYDVETGERRSGRWSSKDGVQKQQQSSSQSSVESETKKNQINKPASRKSSPAVSIRSTTISIVSIDENAIDSSIVDSDSDCEADAEGVHNNYVVKKLGQQTTYEPDHPNLPQLNKGMTVISQKISPGGKPNGVGPLAEQILNTGNLCPSVPGNPATVGSPQIGSIALTNSTDVTFGDKHFYEGPVTIQQFLIDSREKDNPAFTPDDDAKDGTAKDGSSNDPPPHSFKYMFNRKAVLITSTIIGLTILVGILTVTVNAILDKSSIRKSKLLGDGDDSRKNIPINSTIELSDDEYKFNGTLLMIHRDEWLARPRPNELTDLKLPVHRVIISHTASDTCETKRICDHRVQIIQSFHMDSFDWDDVGYNFLVSSDGLVYEGRGWDKQGAHTKGYNVDSVGVAFIGTFLKMEPTKEQLEAAQLLLEDGVKRKKLVPDYRLYGARQMSGTESPGEALYRIIRKWPHWSPKI